MAQFTKLIPILVYDDIPAGHDFLVRAFGFAPCGVQRDGKGVPVHGEVRAGTVEIWLHRVTDQFQMASPRNLPAVSSGLVIHVDDVDAHCARARASAHIESEPIDQPYGQREYEARDPEGHRWWFATPLVKT
jgi:uncharacterized glyoxalase superfamily protein PhnB